MTVQNNIGRAFLQLDLKFLSPFKRIVNCSFAGKYTDLATECSVVSRSQNEILQEPGFPETV